MGTTDNENAFTNTCIIE